MEPETRLADVACADFVAVPATASVAEARSLAAGSRWIVLADASARPTGLLAAAELEPLPPGLPMANVGAGAVLVLPSWLPVDQLLRASEVRRSAKRLPEVRGIVAYDENPARLAGVWAGQDFGPFQSVLSTSRGIFSFDSSLAGHPDIPPVQHACAFAQASSVCGFRRDWDELPDDMPPCDNPRHLTAHSFVW
jgi:hypothetical protein